MTSTSAVAVLNLDKGWKWKQKEGSLEEELRNIGGNGWRHAKAFPSEIHTELLHVGEIPHPYSGFNEHKIQWIGDAEWLYATEFSFNTSTIHSHALLEFEGLDTICDVFLNGKKILATQNMFRTYRHLIDLTREDSSLLKENVLFLHFKSARALALAEEAKHGRVRAGSTNLGDPSRVYVRKAQYDWRWDWGPEIMTVGPYRPITIRTFTSRLDEVHVRTSVTSGLQSSLKVDLKIAGSPTLCEVFVELKDLDGNVLRHQRLQLSEQSPHGLIKLCDWDLAPDQVQLWWPVGFGAQPLYDVVVSLLHQDSTKVDSVVKRIGFRSVRLVQEPFEEPDQHGAGMTFLFEVNGVRIFMGGSNWIPADNLLTTITPERYRAWLTLIRDGNQNMVRVWGGGLYESDDFYDICDELGLLVWQDFPFACGVYPTHEEFVENVRLEAIDNVKRIRHHPCLAILCGNNEDYQQVLQWGDVKELPARKIYEQVLPQVVRDLTDPPIPYHPGSPYGGEGWDTADPTVGDVHDWNVWGGKEQPYQDYYKMGGRFVSEFGIPAMPSMRTIEYWMDGAPRSEWYAQSRLMAQHNRAGSFERRFGILMNENFKLTSDLEAHVFTTQIMQADALGFAYQIWRRRWKGPTKQYLGGVLVWQVNDCWPVTSWAIVDYFLRAKPSYYTIARQLAPLSVGIFRTVHKNRPNDRPIQYYEFGATQSKEATIDIWAANNTLVGRPVIVEIEFFDLNNPEWGIKLDPVTQSIQANGVSQLLAGRKVPGPGAERTEEGWPNSYSVVVSARLRDPDTGTVLARHVDWPQPYKYLGFPDPGANIKVTGEVLTVEVQRPVKCLFFSVEGGDGEVKWSDNALDVIPGDPQTVTARGLAGRRVEVVYLGKERASPI
ncbi:hypothetical protein AX16_004970 [Volvariella volvacea WC 439]|nr:hypothetical protein AX16_004970 [Volvariella volvacea WC 439]